MAGVKTVELSYPMLSERKESTLEWIDSCHSLT
jgi:hypothetical protein